MSDANQKRERGRPKNNNIQRTLTFEPEISERLDVEAEKENRLPSNMLNVILKKHFDEVDGRGGE